MKQNKKFIKDISKPVALPRWVLWVGLFAIVIAIVSIMSLTNENTRYTTRMNMLESQRVATADTYSLRVAAANATFDAWSKAVYFVIIAITLGLSFGLSHGIALVRVHKHGNEHVTFDDERRKR